MNIYKQLKKGLQGNYMKDTKEEAVQRELEVCRGCGQPKATGLVVCWHCWMETSLPLKEFDGTFEEWIKIKDFWNDKKELIEREAI